MQGVLGIFRVAMGAGVVLLQSCVHSGFPRIGQGQRDHPPPHTHTVPAEAHPVLGTLLSTGAPPVPKLFKF